MARIVPMTADRFDAMNQIDIEAWSDWATKKFGQAMVFPTKQPVYGTYLDGDPDGSFIAVDERDSPVGYIFTRTHGAVGFFGPFGVVPRAQASHVGKALVEATIRYMERCGCTTIGLETMPVLPCAPPARTCTTFPSTSGIRSRYPRFSISSARSTARSVA